MEQASVDQSSLVNRRYAQDVSARDPVFQTGSLEVYLHSGGLWILDMPKILVERYRARREATVIKLR